MKLMVKYEAEQKELSAEVAELEARLSAIKQDEEDVELFIERLRKYPMYRSLPVRCAWSL